MDRRLLWLAVGSFAVGTVGFAFSSLLPLIAADTHVTVPHAGYLISTFSLAYAVGAPVLSALVGSRDRRAVLSIALVIFSAGNLLAAQGGSYAILMAATIAMGASGGLFAATAQATAVGMAEPEHRAQAISVVVGGTTFAVALGAPLAALIATIWGWHGAFAAIAILALACAAVLAWRLPRGQRGAALTMGERFLAIRRPGIPMSLLTTFLYISGGFAVISYLAPLAMEGAGLSHYALPGMLLAFGVGAIIGNLSSGYLSDRIGATRVVMLSMLLSAGLSLTIALMLKTMPPSIAGPALIGLMVPWGMIGWSFPPAQASRIVGFAPDVANLTLSLNVSALYFGVAFGTVIGGRVLEYATPADLGLAGAALPLLALGLLLLSRRERKPIAMAAE